MKKVVICKTICEAILKRKISLSTLLPLSTVTCISLNSDRNRFAFYKYEYTEVNIRVCLISNRENQVAEM